MDTQANNSLIKVEEFNQIMQSAPATLQRNQTSVSTCNQAGQTLLDTIEAEGGISSDELDAKVSEYLAKTKITIENMNKRRKPLTQLLATVSKSFTSLESAIDVKSVTTIPYKLQQARNKYAAKKIANKNDGKRKLAVNRCWRTKRLNTDRISLSCWIQRMPHTLKSISMH